MIKHTFCHIPNIGRKTEQRLWEKGLLSWEQSPALAGLELAENHTELVRRYLPPSLTAYNNAEPKFFADRLPEDQTWRLFRDFRQHTAYLDIETTGLYFPQARITTIALYDGRQVYTYVSGRNLADFAKDIARYKLLITFNGKCFDIPFIEHEFGIKIPQAHLDLRFILNSLGYTGGLKKIEHSLGLDRGALEGVNGFFAVLLWQEYQETKNEKCLETLLAYNVEDTINLEKLMIIAYNKKLSALPCRALVPLLEPVPAAPSRPNPFPTYTPLIAALKRRMPVWST